MRLSEYLLKTETGASLAKKIGVPDVLVSQWKTGVRKAPAERCPAIERATNGAVTCEDLRPDVDWAYIRNAKKAA